ncbi:SDR family oxidoreductase [Bordetella sp. N]|uniref:SDR family oxidoreductase n=1 Tax=Bordetella sp. N TaxID=1746199 RepID=UPI000710FD9C|nr:SDR family oxidoreductase [Bordetella sp. N]ALM84247.1 3-oxoacyl-ACP reductase [Bordetella sp. N]
MDLGIKGKTALVTASSGGMGKNIAHALAAEGANIVLFARSEDKLAAVAQELRTEYDVQALAIAGDMRAPDSIESLFRGVTQEFGTLDIAVLNSGRPPTPLRATVDETDPQRWDEAYQTQLVATIQVAQRAHQLMTNGGRIIAITSASVLHPMPHHALSTVFRAGITAYLKHLANEIGARGITVNCIAPALIETPHRSGGAAYTPEQMEARKKMNVLGRMGTQDELCATVAFLASAHAGFITGSTVRVDGGMAGNLF